MSVVIGILAALLGLTATAYAHIKIPSFTATKRKIWLTRAVLLAVGTGFGLVISTYFSTTPDKIIALLVSFGIVHFPAALILMIKAKRGETRS